MEIKEKKMQKCKNCETELSEMRNNKDEVTCLRCLKCNPVIKYVAPAQKERRDIDLPWTDERVIEVIDRVVPDMIAEAVRNHAQSHMVITDNMKPIIADSLATATLEITDVLVDGEKQTWREQAKELGIAVYDQEKKRPRLKVDVINDIVEKQKGTQNGESESKGKKED